MLPLGARAIILLVNGLQIFLPGPAFVEQGRVWAPARAPLQRLGFAVKWEAAQRRMLVGAPGQENLLILPERAAPRPGEFLPQYARRHGNLLYVPLVAFRRLGVYAQYDPIQRTVQIGRPLATPQDASLAAILSDPAAWNGRLVRLAGEYLGWSPYPFCYATAHPRDVGVGDFVLRNEGGAIYCRVVPAPLPQRATLGPAATDRPPLTPYESIGRRLSVLGTVEVARDGRPRLAVQVVSRRLGLAGMTCLLQLDRSTYQPGQNMTCGILLSNPDKTPATLPAGPRGSDLSVAGPDGAISVTKLSSPILTKNPQGFILGPGQQIIVRAVWPIPRQALPGDYRVVAHLGEDLETYPATFRVRLSSSLAEDQP